MNISVFGLGYVGCVSLGCLAQNGHVVTGVDSNQKKVGLINAGKATIIEKDIDTIIKTQREAGRISATPDFKSAVLSTDVSMIAVGTPAMQTGHLDLSFLSNVSEQIANAIKEKNSYHVVLIRSTVPPGTNESITKVMERISQKKRDIDFNLVSNPEFLREGTAVVDYYNPPFTIVGTESVQAAAVVRELYSKVSAEFIVTEPRVAEMIKYVSNSFHALKVAFANEVGNICKALSVDSHKLMEIFVKDTHLNISPYYLKPGFAYGGSCLPKDLGALKAFAHDCYLDTPVIETIPRSNEAQIKRAVALIASMNTRKIGFIGLSFKSGTDDLRNSPAVSVIETLIGKGFQIMVYDKDISLTRLTGTNWRYIQEHLPHLSALLASTVQEVTKFADVIVMASSDRAIDVSELDLEGKPIVDLTGAAKVMAHGGHYTGLSW